MNLKSPRHVQNGVIPWISQFITDYVRSDELPYVSRAIASLHASSWARAQVRIDMSEYQDTYTVSRLIGAPPGYSRSDGVCLNHLDVDCAARARTQHAARDEQESGAALRTAQSEMN